MAVESIKAFHDTAAGAGALGRLLFGVRVPLIYLLFALGAALYAWLPPLEAPPSADSAATAEAQAPRVEVISAPPVVEVDLTAPPPVAEPAPLAEPPPAALPVVRATPEPVVRAAAGGPHDAQWLLAQESSRFTLQLLGTHDEATLRRFVRRHRLEAESASYRTTHDGRAWYVLLHGLYADRAEATRAANRLPAEVRANTPWIRPLSAVQAAIRGGR